MAKRKKKVTKPQQAAKTVSVRRYRLRLYEFFGVTDATGQLYSVDGVPLLFKAKPKKNRLLPGQLAVRIQLVKV